MSDNQITVEDDFMQYLIKTHPSVCVSEFRSYYSEIEAFCKKVNILRQPLFQTTDFETIKKVQQTIEQNKFFRITHKQQFNKILVACRRYYLYIKEGHFPRIDKQIKEKYDDCSKTIETASQNTAFDNASVEIQLVRTNQDERLLQKYPIIYKQVYNALLNADCSLSIEILGDKIGRIGRPAVLEEILDNVSWAKQVKDKYYFSTEIADHHIVINEVNEQPVENEVKAAVSLSDRASTYSIGSKPHRAEATAPYRNEAYEMILSRFFKKGFRMESPLEIRKFRRHYSSTYEKELLDSDDEISCNIKKLAIEYDGKAFLPDAMLGNEVKTKLYAYIDSAFAKGKKAIYYQALFAEFSDTFLDHHIYDADMLKAYLAATANGKFYVQKSFVSREENATIDPFSEIRECLIEYGRPVAYEELFEALPHIPQNKIKFLLSSNGEFVNNGQGAYFHEKIVQISDEELEGIAEIISQTIKDKDYMSGNELYDAIKTKYSYIIEENKLLSIYGFRDALKAKLGRRFSFKGNIISHLGNKLSMTDVFAKYAQTHDSFTLSELRGLASDLSTVIYFDAVYENSLRVSKEHFVSKEMAQFAISETDDVLDRICIEKYIPVCEVQNFGIFPYGGFTWNSYLLEHYVASYSRKYKLLHSGFNGTECAGAIVRRSADINSFDDLIIDIIVNNPIELNKYSVLQYLSDKGYLARRRYSEIESLIIKAKAQKQRKDD